jgi:glycosyltransferase involved in cell wall biosynthesis
VALMGRILILSRAVVGPRMASPGIRAYQLAGALGRALPDEEITLATPGDRGEVAPPAPNVRVQRWDSNADAAALAKAHDTIVARNFPPQFVRLLGEKRFALDAFTPLYVEWMELSKRDIEPRWRRTWMAGNRWYLNLQLTMADFLFCADERQRDLWIGMLMALALVPPDMYERDPSLRRFIDIVPYGVPQQPLDARGPVLRGVVPGIEAGDRVLLWNGGITEWNDPFTLLQAMDQLFDRRPEVKLVFMGVNHPDMVFGPQAGVAGRAIEMAKDMGLYGRSVFFLEGWVPYERIDDYLAEADASVCLGYENVESRFAFRTRYVDLFRARVPLLCTRGDVLADRVASDPLGITVPERDVDAVAAGIERLLDDAEFTAGCRERLGAIGKELSWDTAVQPLVEFCASGESFAMPAGRRRVQAYTRGGMYLALKKICRSYTAP